MSKMTIDEVTPGRVFEATFWDNPVDDSKYRLRATHLDGQRAPKVVLADDGRILAGMPCLVEVVSVDKPARPDRGAIFVQWSAPAPFKIKGVYLDPVISRKLQILLDCGLNILLDGPQGCGKTVLARSIASSLGMEFVFFNCGAVIEATDFFATIQIKASETGQPVTDFVKTDILLALEEAAEHPGRRFLVFLDELNRCPESARNALMPALDTTRKIFHPIENRFLPIPDNVQFIAAINRGREFSGTFGIDAAQLDRFAPLQLDYPPPAEEVKILVARHPDLSRKIVEQIVDVADTVRKSPELLASLSVRATDEACIYLEHPLMKGQAKKMLAEVLKSSFCGRFDGRWSDVTTDAGVVWSLVEERLRVRR